MIRHPGDMMINDMIHHHGDTMEIKPLILLIRWQRGGDGGERDRQAGCNTGKCKERAGGTDRDYEIWDDGNRKKKKEIEKAWRKCEQVIE